MDCPSTPAAPLFALTLLYASHTSRFGIWNGLSSGFDLPTRLLPGDPGCSRDQTTDEPAPSLHARYRRFIATTSWSASARRIGTRRLAVPAARRTPSRLSAPLSLARVCRIGTRLPTFRAEAAAQAHAACMPDTAWPVSGHPPGSFPGSH